jgi:hypothetical protein
MGLSSGLEGGKNRHTTFSGTTYYVEWKVTIHDTAGSSALRVDGDSKLSVSSVDTKNTANATANGVRLGQAVAGNCDYDDLLSVTARVRSTMTSWAMCASIASSRTGMGRTAPGPLLQAPTTTLQ